MSTQVYTNKIKMASAKTFEQLKKDQSEMLALESTLSEKYHFSKYHELEGGN